MADYGNLDMLLENDILTEDVKEAIKEQWKLKVEELKEEISAEVRDEFALKFERDKKNIVDGLGMMVEERLKPTIKTNNVEKQKLIKERVEIKKSFNKQSKDFAEFCKENLTKELNEFKEDRHLLAKNIQKTDKFVIKQIAESVKKMEKDRQKLVEDRVKFKIESKKELKETKSKLVTETAKVVKTFVKNSLQREISEMQNDILEARKNQFGKKIFEAYGAEYVSHFFNKNKKYRELSEAIRERDARIGETRKLAENKEQKIIKAEHNIRIMKDRLKRQKVLENLLLVLTGEKRVIMKEMLEDVSTSRLKESFDSYLPTLIEGNSNFSKKRLLKDKRFKKISGEKLNILSEDTTSEKSDEIINDIICSVGKIK